DLALRNGAYGAVLPDYAAVILDEAHQIEDVASEYFGSQVSSYQLDELLRDVGYLKIDDRDTEKELGRVTVRIQRFADLFWISFQEGRGLEGRFTLTRRARPAPPADGDWREEVAIVDVPGAAGTDIRHRDAYAALDNVLHRLETTLAILQDASADAESI